MQLKMALSVGLCPKIYHRERGVSLDEESSLERLAQKGCILFEQALRWAYSLRRPASIATTTLVLATVVTFAFYPQTALILASPLTKTALMALHHFFYVAIQMTLTSLATRAWIRLNPEKEPLYITGTLVPHWDFLA